MQREVHSVQNKKQYSVCRQRMYCPFECELKVLGSIPTCSRFQHINGNFSRFYHIYHPNEIQPTYVLLEGVRGNLIFKHSYDCLVEFV